MNFFTPEDLLEYYYQETSSQKAANIAEALKTSWSLQQKYNVICEAAERLDKAFVSPRVESVQAIINYAAHEAAANV